MLETPSWLNLPFQFTDYVPDTTTPTINEFLSADLSLRQLAIEFSEPVDIATANVSGFTLRILQVQRMYSTH